MGGNSSSVMSSCTKDEGSLTFVVVTTNMFSVDSIMLGDMAPINNGADVLHVVGDDLVISGDSVATSCTHVGDVDSI